MSDPKPWPETKVLARKALGAFLLVATVGLATCQSVVESVLAAPAAAGMTLFDARSAGDGLSR